jgi:hypothetical protein
MSKRRATKDPEGTVSHLSESPRFMAPMSDRTNAPPKRTGIFDAEIPNDTMTMRQIRRHIDWLIGTAETGWNYGNKEAVEARLEEVLEFNRILPTRTFEELAEDWYGQSQKMVDEAFEKINEMRRTIKRKIPPTR